MKVRVPALKKGGHIVRKGYSYTRPGKRKSNPTASANPRRRRRSRR